MNLKLSTLLALLIIGLISGCATTEKTYDDNAEGEYTQAKELIQSGDFGVAGDRLKKFSANYPYSKHAIQSELLRIYAAYKHQEFILSETMSKRFIDRHPRHANVDYAKYMLAMSYFEQRTAPEKDITMFKSSIDAFERLLKEHPNSSYAKSGQTHLRSLFNALAVHELVIGKFYFDHDRFVASANRFQDVVRLYQTTPSIEEALYYLSASYAKMGLRRDARQTAMILRHNHPNSSWSSKVKRFL